MLVLIEGLSYAEAAQVLEVPEGTVTSRLARGRAALRELLGDDAAARTGEGANAAHAVVAPALAAHSILAPTTRCASA